MVKIHPADRPPEPRHTTLDGTVNTQSHELFALDAWGFTSSPYDIEHTFIEVTIQQNIIFESPSIRTSVFP